MAKYVTWTIPWIILSNLHLFGDQLTVPHHPQLWRVSRETYKSNVSHKQCNSVAYVCCFFLQAMFLNTNYPFDNLSGMVCR